MRARIVDLQAYRIARMLRRQVGRDTAVTMARQMVRAAVMKGYGERARFWTQVAALLLGLDFWT